MKRIKQLLSSRTTKRNYLIFMMVMFAAGFLWMPGTAQTEVSVVVEGAKKFVPFSLFSDPNSD